ncbi:transposon protein, CACTA, En/Spm sub-class [Tanacetum coccineum]
MMVLELFFEALEEIGDVVMPKSYYDANKIVSELGFSYETWDACPNDCMLFCGDDKFLDSCSICEASRYKKFNSDKQDDDDNAPGDKIDVYLQLLIDELKDLWRDGVSMYDASTKKTVYKKEDVFKKRKREELEKENKRERKAALGSEKKKMKEKMKGKGKMNVKVKQKATNSNEKKGIAGKTKDHLNTRLDLKELNIRPSLHPQETNSSIILLPPACFTLGKDEKYRFLKLLKDLKAPNGYASNIS